MNTQTATRFIDSACPAWSAMSLLAMLVAAYAIAILAQPAWRPPLVRDLLAHQGLSAMVHFSCGTLALLTGALQFSSRLRGGSAACIAGSADLRGGGDSERHRGPVDGRPFQRRHCGPLGLRNARVVLAGLHHRGLAAGRGP
jgi:hypothetical protein